MSNETRQRALELAVSHAWDKSTDQILAEAAAFDAFLAGAAKAEAPKSRSGQRKKDEGKGKAEAEAAAADADADADAEADGDEEDMFGDGEAEQTKALTKEDVRKALKDHASRHDQKSAVTILRKYAKTLEELKPSDFDAIVKAAKA